MGAGNTSLVSDPGYAPSGSASISGAGMAQFASGSVVTVSGPNVSVENVTDVCNEVTGPGTLTILGEYAWNSTGPNGQASHWTGTGSTQVGTADIRTAKLYLTDLTSFKTQRPITNYATIDWDVLNAAVQTTTLELEGAAYIENLRGATFNINSVGGVSQTITAGVAAGPLRNRGTLNFTTPKTITIDVLYFNLGGNVNLKNVKFTKKAMIEGGAVNNAFQSQLTFAGSYEQTGGEIINAGKMDVLGGFQIAGGTVRSMPAGMGLTSVTTDTLTQTGGDIVTAAAWTVTDRYAMSGGTLLNQGGGMPAAFAAGTVDHTGGTITSPAAFRAEVAYNLSADGVFTTVPAGGMAQPVFVARTLTQTGGNLVFLSTGSTSNFNVTGLFAFQGGTAEIREPMGYGTAGLIGLLDVTGTGLTLWGQTKIPGGVSVAADAML
jgi:hypothetical protein